MPSHQGHLARRALLGAGLAALATPVLAAWPERPIRLVIGYPPGGTGDLVGRLVGEFLAQRLGVPVVADNQGGANGSIAARAITRAVPDGYTFMLAGNAIFAIQPHITPNVGYDPIEGFTAIVNISESNRMLAVRNTLPAQNLAEFVAYAKANPGRLNYGSSGIGSTLHIMMEMLKREAGFEAVHVPFRGSAPSVQALLRGDVDFTIDTTVIPHVEQGRLRGLASVGDRRIAQFPDLPTLAEQGYPGVRTSGWQALMGPPGMPAEVVNTIAGHVETLLREPAFLDRLARVGVVPSFRAPAQLREDLIEDHRQFGAMIRAAAITAE
jgi:tripartite-type tricarboxylate transporter receptor subunit TctC